MIGRLIDYVYRVKRGVINPVWQKSVAEYTPNDADFDAQIMMSAKLAQDPYHAHDILNEKESTPWDLIKDLPLQKTPKPWQRFLGWLARLEGSLPYIPYQTGKKHDIDNRQDFKQPSQLYNGFNRVSHHHRRYKR